MSKPFTDAVRKLHASGMTYNQMDKRSRYVRSAAWWCQLVNGTYVRPPKSQEFDRFAELLGTSVRHVGLMVAEEWFGISYRTLSQRVLGLEATLDALSEADAEFVEKLAKRLAAGQLDDGELAS